MTSTKSKKNKLLARVEEKQATILLNYSKSLFTLFITVYCLKGSIHTGKMCRKETVLKLFGDGI